VYASGTLSSSANGFAGILLNTQYAHLDTVNGPGLQFGSLTPIQTCAPVLATDNVHATAAAVGANGQTVTGGNNGTGYARLLRWEITYWQQGTKLNEGGCAYIEDGSAGRSIYGVADMAVPVSVSSSFNVRSALPFAVRAPLSNESHTIRGAPTLPDNLKFTDIVDEVSARNNADNRKIMPEKINEFADATWSTSLMFRTAAASQPIGYTITLWYETYHMANADAIPAVPATHTSLASPTLATAQSNSVMTAYHRQKSNNFAGFATKLIESGAKSVGRGIVSAGKDLVTGQFSSLAMDGLKLLL